MRKLYADEETSDRGTTTWHNPTEMTLKIRMFGNNGPSGYHPKHAPEGRPLVVEPGAEVEFDAGYDANLESICGLLKKGPAPKSAAKPVDEESPAGGRERGMAPPARERGAQRPGAQPQRSPEPPAGG